MEHRGGLRLRLPRGRGARRQRHLDAARHLRDRPDTDGDTNPANDPAKEAGIDGVSNGYVAATFDLSAYAGQTIGLRARYVTDGAVQGQDASLGWSGLLVDDIKVTNGGTTVFADGAETTPNGWTLDGFRSIGAGYDTAYDQFYLASNRTYTSYDQYLQTGPYNFSFPTPGPTSWRSSLPGRPAGQLLGLVLHRQQHQPAPGGGLVLPVDANPQAHYNLQGTRGAVASRPTTRRSACRSRTRSTSPRWPALLRPGRAANPLFDDSDPNGTSSPSSTRACRASGSRSPASG